MQTIAYNINQALKGLLSYFPGILNFAFRCAGDGDSARYCYSVWLRHLVKLHSNKVPFNPKTILEFGPGQSLGLGFCALICGSEKYFAFFKRVSSWCGQT